MRGSVLFGLWFVLGFSSAAFAQNLFQKIPPSVQHGMEAYKQERFEQAHEAFEEAQTQMPANAQLEFNRGTTLYKQEKYQEALQSFSRARELNADKLRGDIFYNMGNTYAAMGNTADAIASYRQALRMNPEDSMARHNLEFLLHQPPPPQKPQKNNDTSEEKDKPDNTPSDAENVSSQQASSDKTTSTPSDNETQTQGQKDTPQNADDTKTGDKSKHSHSKEEALDGNTPSSGRRGKQLSQEDADKILDAFGMDEKSYEPWRFQKKPPVEEWQYEKDW